jgi:hypothetical protein
MNKKITLIVFLLLLIGCGENSIENSLIEGNKITAAYNFKTLESLVYSYDRELKLLSIRSDDVDYEGFALEWCFRYSSDNIAVDYYFHTTSKEVVFDSTSTAKNIGSTFISHPWFDSSEAFRIAERNGGKEFRKKNLEYSVQASLGEPLIPNSRTFWYITYYSKTERLMLAIDADSGETTLIYKSYN